MTTWRRGARKSPTRSREVDTGEGAIILTDLFGGTPSNLAISLMEAGKVEVIAGINLPMLIRLAGARKKMTIGEAVSRRARCRPQLHHHRVRISRARQLTLAR